MIDEKKEIRRAVDTGTVLFGSKQSERNILKGKGELIIISNNTDKAIKERIIGIGNIAQIPFYEFKGNSIELGAVCGKPFPISVMIVLKKGKSKISPATEKKKTKTREKK
ncbi:MAG: 50S ribosomal protein L30e [archaeon]|nr:50S ribosomal protein L30e [Candidatus Micrarchaeota archaeon]